MRFVVLKSFIYFYSFAMISKFDLYFFEPSFIILYTNVDMFEIIFEFYLDFVKIEQFDQMYLISHLQKLYEIDFELYYEQTL